MRIPIVLSLFLLMAMAGSAAAQQYAPGEEGTFSIIGLDPTAGELGIAVQSKTIAVGSRTRGGKGGLAVFAHQAASDPMYSTIGIELLEAGMTPQQALDMMLRSDDRRDSRQVSILDIHGRTATWTGPGNSEWKGSKCGVNYCAQGNTLAGPAVVSAMAKSFESSSGPLAERLLDAIDAGQAQGGDKRGMESASLMILKPLSMQGFGDRKLDLRVDESRNPFVELRRILNAVRAGEMVSEVNAKLNAQDLKGALELATAAHDKCPTSDNALIAIARIHLRMGQKAEALVALRKAVELNGNNKKQLQVNKEFTSLARDAEFRALVGTSQ
jgi:uncharacterized Ntn-hydrolase superfamily protein